jgi:uncharacterized Rmd1/YagE family protein
MNLEVAAYHLGKRIRLVDVRNQFSKAPIRSEHSFLLYLLDDSSYLYFKDYGSVVFVNCGKEQISDVFQKITPQNISLNELPTENYTLNVKNKEPIKVGFDFINVTKFDIDIAHVVMLNLAQSVALDFYLKKVSLLLEYTSKHSHQLEVEGKINLTRKQMRKFIGKTMILKNKIADNLFIFDTSTVAWSTEELSKLDSQMKKELDIVDRHQGLQDNIGVVKENLDLFRDILQHKHSSLLEWIIIILILFEVVQLIIEKLF